MFCVNCGTNSAEGTKFCSVCGTPLESEEKTAYAPPGYAPVEQTPVQPQTPVYYAPVAPAPQKPKNNTGLIVGIIVSVLVIIGAAVAILFATGTFDSGSEKEKTEETDIKKQDKENKYEEQTEAEKVEEETPNNITPSRGVVSGNVYKSSYFGITFTKPSDWRYATDEEMLQIMGISSGLIEEDYKAYFEKAIQDSSVYDMMVISPTNANVIVTCQKIDTTMTVSESEFLNLLAATMREVYTYELTFGSVNKGYLGNQNYYYMDLTMQVGGIPVSQRYYARYENGYVVTIILSSQNASDFAEMEKMFS